MKVGGAYGRKTIPLIVLVLLVASLPPVKAAPEVESLYVDSYTGDLTNWDERNAPSPYLADEDTGFVHEVKSSGATEGYFGFADPSGSGTINSVILYIECYGEDTNDKIDIYVDCSDGSGWVEEGIMTVDQLTYGWETLSLSTRLDSWSDIQNAQIYLYYQGVAGGDDIYVRRAYLSVDYTLAGEEYIRDVAQAVSWSGAAERGWSTTRVLAQGVSLTSGCERVWSTSRLASTDIIFASDSLRSWSLSRVVSQTLSVASNAVGFLTELITRSVTLEVTLTSNAARSWILLRDISQSISLATDSGRLADFSRGVSQGISLVSNALGSVLSLIERTVSLTIDTSFSSSKVISVIRKVSQTILTQISGGGILNPGSSSGNGNGVNPSALYVVNEFNTSMIMMNVLTVLATGVYLFMGRDFAWGAVATFLWFITALAMLVNDPSNWIVARVYGAFGSIFVVLTIVSVIQRLNPEDQYFDEWD